MGDAADLAIEAGEDYYHMHLTGECDQFEECQYCRDEEKRMKELVMLAHEEEKHGHKMTYPAYIQPKLDGVRCIAIKEQNNVKLFTRSSEEITSCPHLYYPLQQIMQNGDVLDGELYHHEAGFDRLSGDVRSKDNRNTDYVQYWIYDHPVVLDDKKYNQQERVAQLQQYVDNGTLNVHPLMHVPTFVVNDREHVMRGLEYFMEQGYEGCMIRNATATYGFGKRSPNLLKVKKFYEQEFEIADVIEGKGKLEGAAGSFVCKMDNGKTFKCKLATTEDQLRSLWTDRASCIGRKLTVKYQELTKTGTPRFPTGKGIRWDV